MTDAGNRGEDPGDADLDHGSLSEVRAELARFLDAGSSPEWRRIKLKARTLIGGTTLDWRDLVNTVVRGLLTPEGEPGRRRRGMFQPAKRIGNQDCRIMNDISDMTVVERVEFAENPGRQHAAHYREQAAQFRSMAEVEPLASLRRHLRGLVRQYEELATHTERADQG